MKYIEKDKYSLEWGNYNIYINDDFTIKEISPVQFSKNYKLDISKLFRKNPEMYDEEIKLILSKLNKNSVVLEWGSGGSTLFFSKYCKEYHSIEHNFLFYVITRTALYHNNLLDKVTLHFCEPHDSVSKRCLYKQIKDYVDVIDKIGIEKYDIIIIDGRGRPFCAEKAYNYIKEDGYIFLLDTFGCNDIINGKYIKQEGRSWYMTDKIKELYDITQFKTIAILTKKKKT